MNCQFPKHIEKIIKSKQKDNTKLILIVQKITKNDKSSHEFPHLQRVHFLAQKIVKDSKLSIDKKSLLAACFFHDLGYCFDFENKKMIFRNTSSKQHEHRAIIFAENILPFLGYSKNQIKTVEKAIQLHDNFKGSKEYIPTKEKLSLVLQDADRIEAIGTIGLARWFRYANLCMMPTYNPNVPFSKIRYGLRQNFSVIHNLKAVAVNIHKDLNFKISRKISTGKEKVVRGFIKEYLKEFRYQAKLSPSYFGAIKLAGLLQKARNEIRLLDIIRKTIRESHKTTKLVLDCLSLLKKELRIYEN